MAMPSIVRIPVVNAGTASEVSSVCCYCGTGCGVRVQVRDGAVLQVRGDETHPANRGRLCSKGLALGDTVRRDGARVLSAQWREARGQPIRDIALGRALDLSLIHI